MVIAFKRAIGPVEFPPSGDDPLRSGDSVILLGRHDQLDDFRRTFCPKLAGDQPPKDS